MKTATRPKSAPAASTPTPAVGIRKINFGGIAVKAEKTVTEYPILPDPTGDVAKLSSEIIAESREFETLTAAFCIVTRRSIRRGGGCRIFGPPPINHWFG